MKSHGVPVNVEESYLHATPNLHELDQPVLGDSFKTASLPEINESFSKIRDRHLRFAYERIWSILVYLAYNNFQKVSKTLKGPHKQKMARFKEQLLGSGGKSIEIHCQAEHWKDLVACSDCGILLLVKQRFLPVIPTHKFFIAKQYSSTVKDTEQLCRVFRDILSAFSPTYRDSISYYTKAYEELNDLINRESTSSPQSPQLALVVAKSPPTCLGSPEFENSTHDSFVAGKLQLSL
jgi:hypothetical protein